MNTHSWCSRPKLFLSGSPEILGVLKTDFTHALCVAHLTHVPVVVVPGGAVHPGEGSVPPRYFPRYPGVLGMREMREERRGEEREG